jgi:hypothetical protein
LRPVVFFAYILCGPKIEAFLTIAFPPLRDHRKSPLLFSEKAKAWASSF